MPAMPASSQTRVHRRAVACARCRVRKVMCDAQFPTCSTCLDAGVACVALDSSKQRVAPRSIARFLEAEIASAEKARSLSGPRNKPRTDHPVRYFRQNVVVNPSYSTSTALLDAVLHDLTSPFLGLTASVPLVRCSVAGTRLPSTRLYGTTDIDERHPRSILNPQPPGAQLFSIPASVADFLFENYMTRVVAQYPIFYSAEVIKLFNSVFHSPRINSEAGAYASPYEIYVVSLIMAISLTTAARTQQVRANSIAVGLFKTAIQHLPTVCTNDLPGLQALLLLLQYTFLDPSAANLWLLSGFTSQACIDMGLHQESADEILDPLTRDIRRRVFWCTYEMEIATCAGLLRPTSLLSKHINVPFPSEIEDTSITTAGIHPDGRSTKFTAIRIWQFRKIEAEIVNVLFHNGEIAQEYHSLEAWMEQMEMSINQWHVEVQKDAASNIDPSKISQWKEMLLYADIARDYIIVTLYRPCALVKVPTCENLMKAFVAAVGVADGYMKQSNLDFGNSKYVFHPCHHTFSGAVVFLQALQRCKETVSITYSFDQVQGFISCFSRFFATIAERWPAASRCLEEFERLVAPVKKEYLEFTVQQTRTLPQNHPELASFVDYRDDPMNTFWDLDEMVGFGPHFASGLWNPEQRASMSYAVPIDWNAEFDFGMS